MKYSVLTLADNGSLDYLIVEAQSNADARQLASGKGLRVIEVKQGGSALSLSALLQGSGRADQLQLCAAVEQVLGAGLTLTEALQAISIDNIGPASTLAESLLVSMRRGNSPSLAFEAHPSRWSPLLIALVRSGERTGALHEAFGSYVAFETGMSELRSRLISASVYPVVLLLASLLVLGFLLAFVVPKFALALEDVQATLPAASTYILAVGLWLNAHWLGVLIALMLSVVVTLIAFGNAAIRQRLLLQLQRLPVIEPLALAIGRAQAFRITSALLIGGDTLINALQIAFQSANGALREQISTALRLVSEGQRPSRSFSDAGLTGALGQQMLVAAERSATLGPTLHQMALQQEKSTARTLDRLTTIYGPVLLLGIAILVAAVVVALYWPLLQLFESVR